MKTVGRLSGKPLRVDANILIDFAEVDRSILTLISAHVGQIYVLTSVAEEVNHLAEYEYASLGLVLMEPELDHVVAAGQKRGRLSFADYLRLIVARERGWTCFTNDLRLRRECGVEGVSVLWGLESLALLVEARRLGPRDADAIATGIHVVNPKHISEEILWQFRTRIGLVGGAP